MSVSKNHQKCILRVFVIDYVWYYVRESSAVICKHFFPDNFKFIQKAKNIYTVILPVTDRVTAYYGVAYPFN